RARKSEVIGNADCDLIAARPLSLCGYISENAVGGVDACSSRKARVQRVSESLGRQVSVSGRVGEGEGYAFVHGLVSNVRKHRKCIHFIYRARDGFGGRARRSEVVGNADGDLIAAGPLGFRGRPTEHAVSGVDACSSRKAWV